MRIQLRAAAILALAGAAVLTPVAAEAATDLPTAVASAWTDAARTGREITSAATRTEGDWAFGTANAVSPTELPEGRLYLAHRTGREWTVAFERTTAFAELAKKAPVLAEDEKRVLSPVATLTADPGLSLPYNGSWTMTSGPHGWAGSERPFSSVDLAGGDGVVRAAGPGQAYTMCSSGRGWVRIYHDNGWTTDYYHMFNNISGGHVNTGDRLGDIGTDTSCGGSATGNHVHFALLNGMTRTALNDVTIGGWTFHEGAAYDGYATHDGQTVYPGGQLYNYGSGNPGGGGQYPVKAPNGLNGRTEPRLGATVGAAYPYDTMLTVVCQTNAGDWDGEHYYPGTKQFKTWDKLDNGLWVYDYWMGTPPIGDDGYSPGIAHC